MLAPVFDLSAVFSFGLFLSTKDTPFGILVGRSHSKGHLPLSRGPERLGLDSRTRRGSIRRASAGRLRGGGGGTRVHPEVDVWLARFFKGAGRRAKWFGGLGREVGQGRNFGGGPTALVRRNAAAKWWVKIQFGTETVKNPVVDSW